MFLNDYLRSEYGEKVYKLSFDLGATCPNRDGSLSTGGCAFCSEGGSGDFAVSADDENFDEQIEKAKKKVAAKTDCRKFIAYFQSHTNTYLSGKITIEYLEKVFMKAANNPEIVGISIGTRADCINEEIVSLLSKINEIKPVWVEIGLQSVSDKTRDEMNCCFSLSQFEQSFELLKRNNIKTIVHMIVGLPGENEEDWLKTAEYIAKIHPFGIKIQLLHVLKNTKLAEIYRNGQFSVLTMEKYTDICVKIIKMLPEDTVIHRMTGDGPKDILIEPKWSTDKKRVLNTINKKLRENE